MSASVGDQFRKELLAWAEENDRDFPWRHSGATLYEVFVAEFLLTRTTAEAVAEVYPEFISRYPAIEEIERAVVDELAELIEPLGLYNRRANALKRIADRVDGRLPRTAEELEALPQVGPYIANATACIALDQQNPIVDANVDRIYGRLFGSAWPASTDEQVRLAERLLPDGQAREYNLALLDFGATLCAPTNPACEECFANSYCEYFRDNSDR